MTVIDITERFKKDKMVEESEEQGYKPLFMVVAHKDNQSDLRLLTHLDLVDTLGIIEIVKYNYLTNQVFGEDDDN